MTGEHLAVLGGSRKRPAPDADALGLGRRLGIHVVRRLLRECDGHAGLDECSVDVHFAGFADREHSPELVGPALFTTDLLRSDEVEQYLRRRGRAVPCLAAGVTGLALDRRVDAVKDDALAE